MECAACGAQIDHRVAFCSRCGELTSSGRPIGRKLGDALFEIGEELGKLANQAADYVTDKANRRKVIGGGIVIAFLLTVLTENPISNGISRIFETEEPEPQMTEEGLPDFTNYADVFLSEETEYFVTGSANVRNFPTSEETQVINSIAEGETVMAREVKAFDPSSQWFKLSSGGYVWGGNLEGANRAGNQKSWPTASVGLTFPSTLQGRWSDRTSCNAKATNTIKVSKDSMLVNETWYGLEGMPDKIGNRTEYSVYYSGETDVHVTFLTVFLSADGRSIAVREGSEDAEPLLWVQDEGLLGCD